MDIALQKTHIKAFRVQHSNSVCMCVRAVGIALLVVILAALLILGCWYFRRRSGYKMIRVRSARINQYQNTLIG